MVLYLAFAHKSRPAESGAARHGDGMPPSPKSSLLLLWLLLLLLFLLLCLVVEVVVVVVVIWRGPKGLWAKGLYIKSGCDTFQHALKHVVFSLRMRKGLGDSL